MLRAFHHADQTAAEAMTAVWPGRVSDPPRGGLVAHGLSILIPLDRPDAKEISHGVPTDDLQPGGGLGL